MAIISVLKRRVRNVIGDRVLTQGSFKIADGAGGEIDTGLEICEDLRLQGTATTTAGTARIVVNADFPMSGSAVPVITELGGYWIAYGR